MNKEPSVLTRMRLSCCWGDNLNEKELNEVVDYINYLQQENKELKEENFNLREYINIDKMSIPYKNDSFEELMTMPTYKKLEQQLDLYKSILDEIRKYIDYYVRIDDEHYDRLKEILDKANEQKW